MAGPCSVEDADTLEPTAAGADGLMVEVHVDPERALSDGGQSLNLEGFEKLMDQVRRVADAVDRGVVRPERSDER